MKRLCAVFAMIITTAAFARTEYTCFLPKEANSAIRVVVMPDRVVLRNQKEIIDTDSWEVKTGKAEFDRKGIIGGNGSMRGRLLYSLNLNTSQVYATGGQSHFYIEKALVSGGRILRPGFRGGLMTFVNHKKQYESYVCYIKGN